MTDLPLSGARVLDFSRVLSGPYCSLLLSDLGADVIKVERPGSGDDTRHWGPPFLDGRPAVSTYFASLNRGKRSVAVDLATDAGRGAIYGLIPEVDIVLENFRPGVAEDLGLGHDRLSELNPAIVSCSISGYGRYGPYATFAGTEIVVEAMSGLMEITGEPEGPPVRFGIAMVDISTGLTAAGRILAALLEARRTGRGAHIDCSLYAAAIAALGTLITSYTATGAEPRRLGSHHPTVAPYGGFATSDGYLVTGVINDDRWPAFCDAIELPELTSRAEFATNAARVANRAALESVIDAQCSRRPLEYWLERLRSHGLLAAPIRTVGEAVDDPATRQMGLFVELEGHPGILSPKLDGDPAPTNSAHVPDLGEHTDEVLAGLLRSPERAPAAASHVDGEVR
jgi:crotonobetainyl-CoA:carnitine CoA-transferase CaiB-like acyl-CoA transferase